jgi:hypothetical protein
MSRACCRISAAALGSGRPISKRRQSSSCSDDSGITLSAHPQAFRNARLREDVPARKKMFQLERRTAEAVLFPRRVRFVSGGGCWFAIHSACSASLSHSRTSSSKPALTVGWRVSCPRCSARLAVRDTIALSTEHAGLKVVPASSPIRLAGSHTTGSLSISLKSSSSCDAVHMRRDAFP